MGICASSTLFPFPRYLPTASSYSPLPVDPYPKELHELGIVHEYPGLVSAVLVHAFPDLTDKWNRGTPKSIAQEPAPVLRMKQFASGL